MYILTFTQHGSNFVEVICKDNKEGLIKDVMSYFDNFVKIGDKFYQKDLLNLIKFILDPYSVVEGLTPYDVPRIKLEDFHFSLVKFD